MDQLDESGFFRNGRDDDDDFIQDDFVRKKRQRCLTCNKDLSHLDPIRRSYHVNRCLDNEEVKLKADRIRDDYDKTRDCPLCFEPLTPGPHRITHYKQCAKSHNVSAAEMNELVALNDRVSQIRKRSGVVHTRAKQRSIPEIQGRLQNNLRKKNKIGPKNLSDEHLQMAVALSLSENFVEDDSLPVLENTKQKQLTLPTLLESTDDEARLNLLQDRLLQTILTSSSNGILSIKQVQDNDSGNNWQLTRWWRLHAMENLEPSSYQIELLKRGFASNEEDTGTTVAIDKGYSTCSNETTDSVSDPIQNVR